MGFKVASRVRGLSDEAFREAFGAEEQCRSALSRLRWPDGFVCPACGHRGHCVLAGRSILRHGQQSEYVNDKPLGCTTRRNSWMT